MFEFTIVQKLNELIAEIKQTNIHLRDLNVGQDAILAELREANGKKNDWSDSAVV